MSSHSRAPFAPQEQRSELLLDEVLGVVFCVRPDEGRPDGQARLNVLLWRRAEAPQAGRWALPGGLLGAAEDVESSIRRQLAVKVDLAEVAHVEQLGVRSDPHRSPGVRRVAIAFLCCVPSDARAVRGEGILPADTAWHPVDLLRPMAFDHADLVADGLERLRAKLSYTNLAFSLAPRSFTIAELREVYSAVLGHHVDSTNLVRVLSRRGMLQRTGGTSAPGAAGGRPAALYSFALRELFVTDPFATLRPPVQ